MVLWFCLAYKFSMINWILFQNIVATLLFKLLKIKLIAFGRNEEIADKFFTLSHQYNSIILESQLWIEGGTIKERSADIAFHINQISFR